MIDSVNNQPLAGIEIRVIDAERDTVAATRSGIDGRFTFSLPPGTYTLCTRCIGRRPKQTPVEVPYEGELVIRLAELNVPPAHT